MREDPKNATSPGPARTARESGRRPGFFSHAGERAFPHRVRGNAEAPGAPEEYR